MANPPTDRGLTIWFTGLSSAGKTTISQALHQKLESGGRQVEWLDGDVVRQRLSKDLGFSAADRNENIRRIAELAEDFTRRGAIVLVSAISPYRAAREEARRRIVAYGASPSRSERPRRDPTLRGRSFP